MSHIQQGTCQDCGQEFYWLADHPQIGSRMTYQKIVICDVCETIIKELIGGQALVIYGDTCQQFKDRNGYERHACLDCCKLLVRAQQLGLVKIPMAPTVGMEIG